VFYVRNFHRKWTFEHLGVAIGDTMATGDGRVAWLGLNGVSNSLLQPCMIYAQFVVATMYGLCKQFIAATMYV
jgi:hypothetical protein